MIEYSNYDKAIIVAGNGDYHCLIEYLESKKKLGYVIIPNAFSYPSSLRKFRKYFVYMNNLKAKLEQKSQNIKKGEGVTFGQTLGVPSHCDNGIISLFNNCQDAG